MTDALSKSVESLEEALQAMLLLPLEADDTSQLQQQLVVMQKLHLMQDSWRLVFGYK